MTDEQLFQLIRTLPRSPSDLSSPEWQKEFCSRCLKKAHERSPHGEETVKYFLHYFPNRNYTAQTMLIDAFVGFISGVEEAVKELEGNHERAPLPRLRPDDG